MIRVGTSYFVSRVHARNYYPGATMQDINDKIRDGEIHIGKPPVKEGEKIVLVDGGRRYAIEEQG